MDIDKQLYLMSALYHVNCLISLAHMLNPNSSTLIDESYLEEILRSIQNEQKKE